MTEKYKITNILNPIRCSFFPLSYKIFQLIKKKKSNNSEKKPIQVEGGTKNILLEIDTAILRGLHFIL